MAIDDNTSYELTGAQVKDLASRINAKEDSADLAAVAESGSYNDLLNKPTIPAAQVNSDWDAASGVAQILNKPTLATVATSGSYSDLSNKPTIGNATLTIQKNGTSVDTFTANATSNKTINITVPTTAADVSALPASTKYGASIAVSINTTDYKVTTTLKDQDGNTLGTAQVIDLPLESVVVNGSYDNTNKKIILTLQNGNTIDIPVADLVAGLQTEITAQNMLSSDLVDDTNHTHKFTTAADITKLAGIATGAEVNQNAFSNVKVGSTTVSADSKTDTLELVAGSNVTLTPDATNDKVTIAATDTTYSDATTSASGLMSATDKTKLNGIATGAEVNVQSDWSQTDNTADDYIKSKPNLATVATSGAYSDLSGTPTLATVATSGSYNDLSNKPTIDTALSTSSTNAVQNKVVTTKINEIDRYYRSLVPVGTAIVANKNLNTTEFLSVGKYYCSLDATVATLTNCPTNRAFMMEVFSPLSTTIDNETTSPWVYRVRILTTYMGKMYIQRANSSSTAGNFAYGAWEEFAYSSGIGDATLTIQKNGTNVQTFTANATSNKTANITVPTKTSDLNNDSNFVASSSLATVATSGSYNDLSNKPTIPAAQVNSDWDASSGVAQILNKPSLATVATSGSYNDLSNKPTIPTVNNGTLTIQKNGTTVNTFTANSSNNVTANIPVPTLSTTDTDPGEGSALAADTFLGVYDIAPTAIDGSRITNGTVTTNKLANNAVTAAKVDFSTFGVAATVNGPSSTTSKATGGNWASTDMYTGSVSLAAGTYLVVVTGSSVAFSAAGQQWFNVVVDSATAVNEGLAWFSGAVLSGNGVGIITISTSGTHSVAYQLGAQNNLTATLYSGSKISFVRIG